MHAVGSCLVLCVTLFACKAADPAGVHYFRYQEDDVVSNLYTLTTFPAVSLVKCGTKCYATAKCVTFTFTKKHKTASQCRLQHKLMTSRVPRTPRPGSATFYLRHADWREKSGGSSMAWPGAFWECFKGVCMCTPGYYYSQSTRECIRDCPAAMLRSGYMKYHEYEMWGGNINPYLTGSVATRKAECDLNSQCLTFELERFSNGSGKRCFLQYITALTNLNGFRPHPLWDVYQRNCA